VHADDPVPTPAQDTDAPVGASGGDRRGGDVGSQPVTLVATECAQHPVVGCCVFQDAGLRQEVEQLVGRRRGQTQAGRRPVQPGEVARPVEAVDQAGRSVVEASDDDRA